MSRFLNVVESPEWYNEVYGGGSMSGYKVSEISKRKNSVSHIGKRPTDEVRQRLSIAQKKRFANCKNHPLRGLTVSLETRQKMSDARKGMFIGSKSVRSYGIVMITPDDISRHFGSIREAERETGVNRSTIQYRISVNKPDKNGIVWRRESEVCASGEEI